jgi:hypothetical protein
MCLLSGMVSLIAQKSDYGSQTKLHSISSNEQKDYQLKVTLPKNYDANNSYKSLYYLDSWWLSEAILGSYALLNLTQQVDDIVLIGISVTGTALDWNIQRSFDFTPSTYKMPVKLLAGTGENALTLGDSNTGGAELFVQFLEAKVVTFIENEYPNLEKQRGLLGHSFGGLFSFYVMQNRPQLFSDYIIISPSIWWNKPERLHEKLFTKFNETDKPTKLHLSYGEDESKWITNSNIKMDSVLTGIASSRLDYKFVAYKNTNHTSILTKAIYDGLLFLYAN